jgi:Ulp1 family protease
VVTRKGKSKGLTSNGPITRSLRDDWTDDEATCVYNALYGRGDPKEVVAKHPSLETYGIQSIKRESLRRLRPGELANDEIINYSLAMMATRDLRLTQQDPLRKRSHFFSTYFMKHLLDEKGGYHYRLVKDWSKNVPGGNLFMLDKIFCPVHIAKNHWALLVAYITGKRSCSSTTR